MIRRVVLALVAGFVAFLVCIVLGLVLVVFKFEPATIIGGFLTQWAVPIGAAVAVWHFFTGGSGFAIRG